MNRLPITTLQRWRHNAETLAHHAENLRRDISRTVTGRENAELLRTYAGDAAVNARELVSELDRLIDLHTLNTVKKGLATA